MESIADQLQNLNLSQTKSKLPKGFLPRSTPEQLAARFAKRISAEQQRDKDFLAAQEARKVKKAESKAKAKAQQAETAARKAWKERERKEREAREEMMQMAAVCIAKIKKPEPVGHVAANIVHTTPLAERADYGMDDIHTTARTKKAGSFICINGVVEWVE